jgi:hypothetical protein
VPIARCSRISQTAASGSRRRRRRQKQQQQQHASSNNNSGDVDCQRPHQPTRCSVGPAAAAAAAAVDTGPRGTNCYTHYLSSSSGSGWSRSAIYAVIRIPLPARSMREPMSYGLNVRQTRELSSFCRRPSLQPVAEFESLLRRREHRPGAPLAQTTPCCTRFPGRCWQTIVGSY